MNYLGVEVDLLCPCANSRSITVDNAGRVVARVISPGANAPTTAEAEQIPFHRGYSPFLIAWLTAAVCWQPV